MVYFDGKSKRCSFTFMKMQCDPGLHKNSNTKNLRPFLQFPQSFFVISAWNCEINKTQLFLVKLKKSQAF